jgi:glycosyltransferase involved in cell wall biosynthesis
MRAFERFAPSLADYDWVLFSGSFAPMAATQRRGKRNLLYCHTIPRFAYDLRSYYRERLGTVRRPLFDWLVKRVRIRYERAISDMSRIAANSSNTQQRLQAFLRADAGIIYPPCDTAEFGWQGVSDYFLSTARLEPYKRVDIVVDAFLRMPGKKLVVASGGTNEDALRRRAAGAKNIVFTGWLSRAGMAELLARSIASIYIPKDEDFGLSPVESMAAGKPVIGVAEGGLRETILDGETGCLLAPDPTVDAVVNAVTAMTPEKALAMRQACEAQALRFGSGRFREEILAFVRAG